MRRPEKTECCERLRHLTGTERGLAAPTGDPDPPTAGPVATFVV